MGMKCPSCGHENIAGEDRCEQCFYTLMQRDLPKARKDDLIQSAMMTAPISELITGQDLLVASESDSLKKVTKIFQQRKLNCLIVYKKKKLVGILSFRDLLRRVAGKVKDLAKVKVGEVMTVKPEWVRMEDPIAVVINKMSLGGFRHVPVLGEDGTPLSIISINDVLEFLSMRDKAR